MEPSLVERLRKQGAVVRLDDEDVVRVTLQVTELPRVPRAERKRLLAEAFSRLQTELEGVVIDEASVSPSAQTAEATIAVDRYEAVVTAATDLGVRVDPLCERDLC